MKVAVIGGRDFSDEMLLHNTLNPYRKIITTIVSGGAKGADTLGEQYADLYFIDKEIYLPNWDLYGKRAGFIRNQLIIEASDFVLAFWDKKSAGTKSSIGIAKKLNKPCKIIYY